MQKKDSVFLYMVEITSFIGVFFTVMAVLYLFTRMDVLDILALEAMFIWIVFLPITVKIERIIKKLKEI